MVGKFVIVIAMLLALAHCGWSPMFDVFKYHYSDHTIIRSYLDRKTGVTHAALGKSKDGLLLYRRVQQNGEMSKLQQIKIGKATYNNPFITGLDDGKTVYIALVLIREGLEMECTSDPHSCSDIYFIQSRDGGESWSDLQQVQRKSMNDLLVRTVSKFFVNPNNGRIWIFYEAKDLVNQKSSVRFVTKDKDSLVFRPEQIVLTDYQGHLGDGDIVMRYFTHNPTFDIYFRKGPNYSQMHHLRSNNNGISWERRIIPVKELCNEGESFSHLIGVGEAAPKSIVRLCHSSGTGWLMETSDDDGKSWKHRTELGLFMILADFIFSGDPNDAKTLRMFVYGQKKGIGYSLFQWKVGKGVVETIEHPPHQAEDEFSYSNRFRWGTRYFQGGHDLYRLTDDFVHHGFFVYKQLP